VMEMNGRVGPKWTPMMRIFSEPFMPEIPWTKRPEGLSLRGN